MKISKLMKVGVLAMVLVLAAVAPVLAQDQKGQPGAPAVSSTGSVQVGGAGLGAGLGMAFTIVGAGYGLGKIGSAALEGMARQPEVAPRIQTAMIIIAAMLEGATLASVILCFLVGNRATF
jgi:F-type H+-transporting ATPase subunit c